jgi:hypothetical protein
MDIPITATGRNFPALAKSAHCGGSDLSGLVFAWSCTVQPTWGARDRGGGGFSINAEMVEAVLGKVAGLADWKIDAISDEPHGKKLWRNSVEAAEK